MFNTSERNILLISCNSYGVFINIIFTQSIFIIQSNLIEVLIHFTARMNSDRMSWSINVNHATALMVFITWRYDYSFSRILLLIAYYYYMHLFLLFISRGGLDLPPLRAVGPWLNHAFFYELICCETYLYFYQNVL